MTYLDYAASAPLLAEAAEAMAPLLSASSELAVGNPSGAHQVARRTRKVLDDARDEVADLLGAEPSEVVFTSGGTEADNLAIFGSLSAHPMGRQGDPSTRPAVVCSAIEHPAVLETVRATGPMAEGRVAPVGPDGTIDLGAVSELLDERVALVSVMLANNETGVVQPLDAVAGLARRRSPHALVHTDAVQAAPWLDLAQAARGADLVSVSGHKCGGPQGVGALVVRSGCLVDPLLHGGGQERQRRSGSENVAGAVGLAAALGVMARDRAAITERVARLRDRLVEGLLATVPGAVECAPRDKVPVLPGHALLRFAGVEQEELLMLLDREGLCASGGSACASGALEPSHVLLAMGVPESEARGALRLTLGHGTTDDDVERALEVVPMAVTQLSA